MELVIRTAWHTYCLLSLFLAGYLRRQHAVSSFSHGLPVTESEAHMHASWQNTAPFQELERPTIAYMQWWTIGPYRTI